MKRLLPLLLGAALLAPSPVRSAPPAAPKFSAADLDRARGMLHLARDEVEKYFYDPARLTAVNFRGRCDAADAALAKARSMDEALVIVAQPFLDIGDSHTVFLPPARKDRVWHPWKFHAIGPDIYVSEVDKGSEAEKRGLRVGDKLLAIDNLTPRRTNLFLLRYMLYSLAPRAGISVVAQAPGQPPRRIDIPGKVRVGSRVREFRNERDIYESLLEGENEDARYKSRLVELPGKILVWRLRRFDREKIAAGLRKLPSTQAVVLDLRDNPGGEVRATEDMLNAFFADSFEAFTQHERDRKETTRVRGKGYSGRVFVLIDANSASASEVFARTVQMRQRGILLGDQTEGALSTGRIYTLSLGTPERFIWFGAMIAVAGMTMSDGSVVEGKGVVPDYAITPTHEQLYRGDDPVLAKALELAGYAITPEAAGKLFADQP